MADMRSFFEQDSDEGSSKDDESSDNDKVEIDRD